MEAPRVCLLPLRWVSRRPRHAFASSLFLPAQACHSHFHAITPQELASLLISRLLFLRPLLKASLFLSLSLSLPLSCCTLPFLLAHCRTREQFSHLHFFSFRSCTPTCHPPFWSPPPLHLLVYWGHFAGNAGWGVLSIGRCGWVNAARGAWVQVLHRKAQRFFFVFSSLPLFPSWPREDCWRYTLQDRWGTALQVRHPIRRRVVL